MIKTMEHCSVFFDDVNNEDHGHLNIPATYAKLIEKLTRGPSEIIHDVKTKLLKYPYDGQLSLELNWNILIQGVMCFRQLEGLWDDTNYKHVLLRWMNSDAADGGQKAVFIEWFVKIPQTTTVHVFVEELFKRSEVFHPEVKRTVKAITGEETPSASNRTCHNFRDTGTCKFGDKCKYIHDPNSKKKPPSGGGADQKKKGSKSPKQPDKSRKITSADRSTLTKPRSVSKVAKAIMNELSEKTFQNASSKDAKAYGTAIMEVVNRMKEQPGKV